MYILVYLTDLGQWKAKEFSSLTDAKRNAPETIVFIICNEPKQSFDGVYEELSVINYTK